MAGYISRTFEDDGHALTAEDVAKRRPRRRAQLVSNEEPIELTKPPPPEAEPPKPDPLAELPITRHRAAEKERRRAELDACIEYAGDAILRLIPRRRRDLQRAARQLVRQIGPEHVVRIIVHANAMARRVGDRRRLDGCALILRRDAPLAGLDVLWGRGRGVYRLLDAPKGDVLFDGKRWSSSEKGHKVNLVDDSVAEPVHGKPSISEDTTAYFALSAVHDGIAHSVVVTNYDAGVARAVRERISNLDLTVEQTYFDKAYSLALCHGMAQCGLVAQALAVGHGVACVPTWQDRGMGVPRHFAFTDCIVPLRRRVVNEFSAASEELVFGVYCGTFAPPDSYFPGFRVTEDDPRLGYAFFYGAAQGFRTMASSDTRPTIPKLYTRASADEMREALRAAVPDGQVLDVATLAPVADGVGLPAAAVYAGDLENGLPAPATTIRARLRHAGPTRDEFLTDFMFSDASSAHVPAGFSKRMFTDMWRRLFTEAHLVTDEDFQTRGHAALLGSLDMLRASMYTLVRSVPPARGFLVPFLNEHRLCEQIAAFAFAMYRRDQGRRPDAAGILEVASGGQLSYANAEARLGHCMLVARKWLADAYAEYSKDEHVVE